MAFSLQAWLPVCFIHPDSHEQKWVRRRTRFMPILLAGCALSGWAASPAVALEAFSGTIVPYGANKMLLVTPVARDHDPSVASKGHYEIYVSPFTTLPNPQGPCTTLNRTATLQVQKRLRQAEQMPPSMSSLREQRHRSKSTARGSR